MPAACPRSLVSTCQKVPRKHFAIQFSTDQTGIAVARLGGRRRLVAKRVAVVWSARVAGGGGSWGGCSRRDEFACPCSKNFVVG